MNAIAASRRNRLRSPETNLRSPETKERVVTYHGITIQPIAGKRSPLAETIRKALKDRAR